MRTDLDVKDALADAERQIQSKGLNSGASYDSQDETLAEAYSRTEYKEDKNVC
jgi:hypothetical protein